MMLLAAIAAGFLLVGESMHASDVLVDDEELFVQGQRISELSDELGQLGEKHQVQIELAHAIADGKQRLLAQRGEMAGLTEEIDRAQEALLDQEAQFKTKRREYRRSVRAAAKGEKHEVLVLQDGRSFEEVELREVSARGLAFRHTKGLMLVDWDKLPPAWKERFWIGDDEPIDHEVISCPQHPPSSVDPRTRELLKLRHEKARKEQMVRSQEDEILRIAQAVKACRKRAARDQNGAEEIRARGGTTRLRTLEHSALKYRARAEKLEGEIPQKQSAIKKLQREISEIDSKISKLKEQIEQSK